MNREINQHSVAIFGERLRREREMRGVSLDEIAEATKIGTRLLRALEEEQFDLLPGGIFNKGFVRAYAKFLGINEEQAVTDYMQAAGESQPDLQLLAQPYRADAPAYAPPQETRSGTSFVILAVILLAIVGGAFGAWKLYEQYEAEKERWASTPAPTSDVSPLGTISTSQTSQSSPVSATAPAQDKPASAPANKTASNSTTAPSPAPTSPATQPVHNALGPVAPGQPFEVVVHTVGPAWMSIKADGKFAVRGIVQAEQTKTIRATDEIVLWTGNAGSTQVSFQGQPVPVPGGVNEVKLLIFTPKGLQPPKPRPEPSSPSTSEPKPAAAPQ